MDEKTIPIKISVIKAINRGLEPVLLRMDCLLKDFYDDNISLSQAEHTALLELRSAGATVELLIDDYIEQASDAEVDIVYLPTKEFNLLLDLSKTAEMAYRAPLANSGMWTH